MAKEQMTEVTLNMRAKWGGRYWAEGKGEVPTEALDDLEEAGVLVSEEEPAQSDDTLAGDDTLTGGAQTGGALTGDTKPLTDDQVEAVKIAAAGLTGDDLRKSGGPKIGALNLALKAGGAELIVTAAQIETIDFGAN